MVTDREFELELLHAAFPEALFLRCAEGWKAVLRGREFTGTYNVVRTLLSLFLEEQVTTLPGL